MQSVRNVMGLVAAGLLGAALVQGCGSKPDRVAPLGKVTTGGGGKSGAGGSRGKPMTDGGSSATNCGIGSCRGHSHCVPRGADTFECQCDTGYKGGSAPVGDALACTVDESCIKLHPLQKDSCRSDLNGAPAIGFFFAVDYCAGTAVLPNKLNLKTAFQIKEDGVDVSTKVESYSTVIGRNVESYVTFAIDVSGSISTDKNLISQLVGQLRTVIGDLKPAAGEPPLVGISILLFGRLVNEYLPFTSNFDAVDQALADIEADPAGKAALVDPGGTSLHEAVQRGIETTERIEALRDGVSEDGVLTTGTLIVVTDGTDTSSHALPPDLVKNTLVNVITVGISSDIDDADLASIGKDGKFLAPTPADWTDAFTEVAQRVKDYPKRSYLLGYCTTATDGKHQVEVGLTQLAAQATATCAFDALTFGNDPSNVCNKDFFGANACANTECGGLLACGACGDDQCCADGVCKGKGTVGNEDCFGEDALCQVDGLICVKTPNTTPQVYHCEKGLDAGNPCDADHRCDPRNTYCSTPLDGTAPSCAPVTDDLGQRCGDDQHHDAYSCTTLNCAQFGTSVAAPYQCLPEARVFQKCAGPSASALCEPGAWCDAADTLCKARVLAGCQTSDECVSGHCHNQICYGTGTCFFDWTEKFSR